METVIRKKSNSSFFLSAHWAFQVLLFMVWTRSTALGYVIIVLRRLPLIGFLGTYIYPVAICCLVLVALPWFRKHIRGGDILWYLGVLLLVLVTLLFYEENAPHLEEQLSKILLTTLPMLFVGLCYNHERDKNVLFWASLIGVVGQVFYQLYRLNSGRVMLEDDMHAAYEVLPSAMVLIYSAFEKKMMRHWILAIFAMFFQFSYGTRGPILCMLVFVSIAVLLQIRTSKNAVGRIVSVILLLTVIFYVFSGENLQNVANQLSIQFSKWGFSTRIFDLFIEGNISDDTGRNTLLMRAWDSLMEHPVFGLGLMGDRVVLGVYVHNIFLELLCNFGLLFGPILILVVVLVPLRAVFRNKGDKRLLLFLIMLICMNFVKLCLSSSYILEQQFFFMMGVCIAVVRQKKYRHFERKKV